MSASRFAAIAQHGGSTSGRPKTRPRRSSRCASDMLSDCAVGYGLMYVARVGAADVRAERAGPARPDRSLYRKVVAIAGPGSSASGADASGAPLGHRPTHLDASQTMWRESPQPAPDGLALMNRQNPATSCWSFR